MARLGTGVITASITEPTGRMIWSSTGSGMRSGSCGRRLGETSQGRLVADLGQVADRVEPWIHALSFFWDDEVIWEGIITEVSISAGVAEVEATDCGVYFQRRRNPSARRFDQTDAAHIMAVLVTDAMGVADPLRVADTMLEFPSRIWSVLDIGANSMMVSDAIDDLEDAGLVWTVHAGRLLIGPGPERHRTATLSDRHLGDGITITKRGKDVCTDVLVMGKGVWAQAALEGDRVGIQDIVKMDSLTTVQECEEAAKRELKLRGVAPRELSLGGGVKLDSSAPVDINELIPGVIVPISTRQTGALVGADMRLEDVDVSWDTGSLEVSVTLGTPGIGVDEREAIPPPQSFDNLSPWEKEQRDKVSSSLGEKDEDKEYVKPGIPL